MTVSRNLILSLCLATSQIGFSAGRKPKTKKTSRIEDAKEDVEHAGHKKRDDEERNPTSADNRGRKHLFIGPRAGFIAGSYLGYGAEAGYNANKHIQLSGNFEYTTRDLGSGDKSDDGFITTTQFNVTIMQFSGNFRYFVLNSFYLGFGAGIRSINYTIALQDTANNQANISGQAISYVVIPHVGNIWTFDNGFYIGCEWLGYSVPLGSSTSSSVSTTGDFTQALQGFAQLNEDLANGLGKASTFRLGVIHLGISF